ncbi:Protein SINE3, partial [Mucuna pruriens]
MKESQTPLKTYARSSEKRNRRLKDSPTAQHYSQNLASFRFSFFIYSKFHITNNSNAALTSISEVHVDSSPISEISYANRSEEDNISLLEETWPETLLPSDMVPSKEEGSGSSKCLDSYELDMFTSMESEIAASNFKSQNAAFYKRLIDEITKCVIEDLYMNTVPEEFDRSYQVLSAKSQIVFLCFCFWIIGVLAIFFFTFDSPYSGSIPT